VTEWSQSRVYHKNASLVRRVIFSSLFYNQNYFYSILLKSLFYNSSLSHLIFPSISIIQMENDGSCNSNNGDNSDVENPSSTLSLSKARRYRLNTDYEDLQRMADKAIIVKNRIKEMEKNGKRKMSFLRQSSGSNTRPRLPQPGPFFRNPSTVHPLMYG
jgi:hypothetical protein